MCSNGIFLPLHGYAKSTHQPTKKKLIQICKLGESGSPWQRSAHKICRPISKLRILADMMAITTGSISSYVIHSTDQNNSQAASAWKKGPKDLATGCDDWHYQESTLWWLVAFPAKFSLLFVALSLPDPTSRYITSCPESDHPSRTCGTWPPKLPKHQRRKNREMFT